MQKSMTGGLVALAAVLLSNSLALAVDTTATKSAVAGKGSTTAAAADSVTKSEARAKLPEAPILPTEADVAVGNEDLSKGIKLYNHKHYDAAMPYLERAVSKLGDATSNYYLADTYFRLGKTADALKEYQASYSLDPQSNVAGYCQQMIRTLSAYKVKSGKLPKGASEAITSHEGEAPVSKVDPKSLAMPPIPGISAGVSYDEASKWDYLTQVKFRAQAKEQVRQAEIAVNTSKDVLKQAQKVAKILVPSRRSWGETQVDYTKRAQKGSTQREDLLEPYQKAVDEAQKTLSDAKMVETICNRAASGADGPVPTTLVPYDGSGFSTGYNPFTSW